MSRAARIDRARCAMGPGPHCLPGGNPPYPDAEVRAGALEATPTADAQDLHAHEHDHEVDHHDHARLAGRRALTIVLGLTATFMVVEFVGGWLSNSLALMADAGHMLTDVAAVGLALFAMWFARRPATTVKTYGYLRMEILAALVNGVTLAVIALAICLEAYRRFLDPASVRADLMLGVAAAGLAVNITAALILHRSAGHSLNVRGAYLHVLGDLLGSVGAVAAALVILATGWTLADPLISVFVAALILFSSWKLVRESVDILLEAVPRHIDLAEVRDAIEDVPGVEDVHDLHVWSVTSGFLAMSGHAVVKDPGQHQQILEEIHRRMRRRFGIRHVTVQLESPPADLHCAEHQ
ncbi:MAG TPA: cation diffusion facilitator family transporter [Longimicrobiales bacterium]|nr:cation diffusion facilitator family transporter [Longimicrobiales bacterium]